MKHLRIALSLVASALAAACVEPAPDLGTDEDELVGGVTTGARPEIGQYFNGDGGWCTATLIGPQAILVAAHCVAPIYVVGPVKAGAWFGFVDRNGQGQGVAADLVHGFASKRFEFAPGGVFTTDLAVVHLVDPVPIEQAVPATMAGQEPTSGVWSTIFGFGCDDRSTRLGAGVKRYLEFTYGTATTSICWGDSGGPVAYGRVGDGGAIWGVNSDFNYGNDWFGWSPASWTDLWADVPLQKRQIEDVIRAWDGVDERGFDRPGFDYANGVVASVGACRAACEADGLCASFSFVPEAGGGRCWRKSAAPEPVPSQVTGVISGLARRLEVGINRSGGDFAAIAASSADACASACGRHASCAAFTYAGGTCWLKSSVPTASACGNCTSGVVGRGLEPGVNRPGLDVAVATATSARDCAARCARDERCEAFTFTGAATSNCWLKDGVPGALPGPGLVSGVRRGVETNTERTGTLLRSFATSTLSPLVCSAACASDGNCASWRYQPPAGGQATCVLFTDVGARMTRAGYVSGLRGFEFQP